MRKRIGRVTHYFNRLGVAVLQLDHELKVGDYVHFDGHTTDFVQPVNSIEINHRKMESAGPGAEVALQVAERVRVGDALYLVSPDWAQEGEIAGSCH